MSNANILWFLPTHGDGRYLGTGVGGREVNFNYLRQIAQAADQLGYFGVLLPTGRSCEDSWIVASSVAPFTERLRYLVAVRPGLQSPSVAARMTATLDRITNGRLLMNVVTVGLPFASNGAATSCFVSPTFSDHSAGVSVMLATGGGGMMVMLTAAVLVMPFATAVAVSVTGVAFATSPFTTPALSTVATDGLLDTQEIFALPMKTFAASRPDASKSVLVPSARVVSPPVIVT